MTTRTFPVSEAVRRTPYPFPDPPPKEDVNDYLYLTVPGYPPALIRRLGYYDTTAVMAGIYVSQELPRTQRGLLYPDLLIAFDIDMEAIIARKGYVIGEQGKPPDFVLEIGSESTGRRDVIAKRDGYAALGIPEYWRFDPSGGRFHRGAALAGDRLVNGRYESIPIQSTGEGGYRGHSPALDLELRWESGRLHWYDPVAQRYLPSYADESDARIAAEERRHSAEAQRIAAEETAATPPRRSASLPKSSATPPRNGATPPKRSVSLPKSSATPPRSASANWKSSSANSKTPDNGKLRSIPCPCQHRRSLAPLRPGGAFLCI